MTTVMRWNPLREFATMQNTMDKLFDNYVRDFRPAYDGDLALDVLEDENAYTVHATLPGLSADDINVNIHDNVLSISAVIAKPEIGEDVRVLVQERGFGEISRSIRLPRPVKVDAVEASYVDGILTLSVPKAEEAKPRQIAIKTGDKLLRTGN